MEKYLRFAWLVAMITSWLSFGAASWHWAEDINNRGMLTLTVIWFVISLVLFFVGVLTRKSS